MNCPTREPLDPRISRKISVALPKLIDGDPENDSAAPKHRTDHDRQEKPSESAGDPEYDKDEGVAVVHRTQEEPDMSSKSAERVAASEARRASDSAPSSRRRDQLFKAKKAVWKVARYIGPGLLIAVAYMDPGNYATDVSAGATYRYRLLVMILVSNIIAIFLQSLAIRLGSITGLDLAQNIRTHCPRWLNCLFFIFAQAAIVATDVAEVIGTAIALNMLFNLDLVIGCLISIVDVFIILLAYKPDGGMKGARMFEMVIVVFVIGVVVCFCVQLSKVHIGPAGELFKGYLPSDALVQANGLYLGSGLVQGRLQEWDRTHGHIPAASSSLNLTSARSSTSSTSAPFSEKYRPSLHAIRACMKWSILELAIALFTLALFVNSAILIVAGASLSNSSSDSAAANGDLFGIHKLLHDIVGKAAGVTFALALLLSGTSAGIVCTMAGQMVTEGQLNVSVRPWILRLATRSISLVPSIVVAACYGKDGIGKALTGSQVALSVILPVVSAPLIWFTCRAKVMNVVNAETGDPVRMRNGWVMTVISVVLWLVIVLMNGALIVLSAMGKG
ncbi:MAG: hypothetical protein M1828_003125 [Chrysothrix sp. TS-e1954]|nr:MAG: hypothetical protein M1828_003125 [Chrysothrix sp. TS-e1954]